MLNKIQYFINWLTYNPNNVPVDEIIGRVARPLFYLWLGFSMFCCLFLYISTSKFTVKTLLASLLISPYLMVSIMWAYCFNNDAWYVYLMPVYPLVLIWVIRKLIRTAKQKESDNREI